MFFKNNNANNSKNNVGLREHLPKVLSVLAAIILWFYVIDVQTTIEEKVISGVTVNLENFDNSGNLDIVSGKEHTIEVTISGTKNDIANISQKDIIATADMNGIESAGTFKLDINIASPSGVTVVNKSASEVSVTVDKTTTRNVEVEVSLLYDKLNPEYEIGNPILSFSSVQVTGPQKVVDSVHRLKAQLDTGEIKNSFKSQLSLVPVDKDGNVVSSSYITLSETSVSVTIPVYKTATVGVVPVFTYSGDYEYKYRVVPETVTVKGDASVIDSISSINTVSIPSTEVTRVVKQLDLPNDISAYTQEGVSISAVEVIIEDVIEISNISDTVSKEVPVSYELSYSNKLNPEAYEIIEVFDKAESVVITGPERVVSMVEKLRAQYNFGIISDTKAGSYSGSCYLIPVDVDGNVVSTTHIKFEKPVIDVKLDIIKKIRVGVRPVFANNTKKYDYTITPNIISLKGSISDISDIEFVETKTLNIEKAGEFNVELELPETISIYDLSGNELDVVNLKVHKVS